MPTTTRRRRPLQAVSVAWHWLRRPIWPCELLPAGHPGLLHLNGADYDVLPIPGGFRLTNHGNGRLIDIDTEGSTWSCDCPDAVFRPHRPGSCKHVVSLRLALTALWQ